MKKAIQRLSLLLAAVVTLALAASAADGGTVMKLQVGSSILTVNGEPQDMNVTPQIRSGRTMLPIRFIAEAAGASVSFDAPTKTAVIVSAAGVEVRCPAGADYLLVNGERRALDSPSYIDGGRTYLPVRAVSEAMELKVDWDAATKTVTITAPAAAPKTEADELFEKGSAYYEAEDYAGALECFQKAAELGGVKAQYMMGRLYDKGHGVQQDYAEAVKWYRKAAEQGDADAQNCLGNMYDTGDGVIQDYAEAMKWYQKAADQGHAGAQGNIGNLYSLGHGVKQDYVEAMKWFRKAADQGGASAQVQIGYLYSEGIIVEQDYAEAMKWFQLAADQGDATAFFNLACMYQNGLGIEKDLDEALRLFKLADELGDEDAKTGIEECLAELGKQ